MHRDLLLGLGASILLTACGSAPPPPTVEGAPSATDVDAPEASVLSGTWKTPGYDYRFVFGEGGKADVWNQSQWCGRFHYEVDGSTLTWKRAAEQPEAPMGVAVASESLCRMPAEQGSFRVEGKELMLGDDLRLWRENAEAPLVP